MLQSLHNEVALAVYVGIDLVGDRVLFAIVFLNADIVGTGSGPQGLAVGPFERRLPDAEVVTLADDLHGLGAGIAIILATTEKEERAHGDGHVGLLVQGRDQRTHHRVLIGLIR